METAKISDSNKKVRIPVDETGLEYDKWAKIFNFPIRTGVSRLSGYCNNAFDFHWHDRPHQGNQHIPIGEEY